MEERHKKILKKKYTDLTRDVRPDEVMDYLIQEDIFDFNDIELVRAEKVTKLQVQKLLSILVTRGPNAFGVFLEALKDRYSWLYEDLNKADKESKNQPQPRPRHDDTSTSEARHPEQETGKPSSDQLITHASQERDTREKAVVHGTGRGSRPLTDEEKVARGVAKMKLSNQRMEVPSEVAQQRVTEKQLNILAGKLGREWENLAIHLDLTKADVDRFKADNLYNTRSQIFAMLMAWRAKNGSAATVGTLIRNLEDFDGIIELDKFTFLSQSK